LTDAEWKAALDNNKDDRLLWPTVVHGFSGLAKKLQEQSNSVKELQGSAKV
jgi:Nucleoporin complex subunit 54